MHRRIWPGWCFVAGLLMLAWPVSAVADDAEPDAEVIAEEAEADEAEADGGDEAVPDEDEEELGEGDAVDEANGADEVPEAEEVADEDEEAVEDEEIADDDTTLDAAGDEEAVVGPGGRELDTSYPGTEDALAARMDTEGVEGLDDIPEGGDPAEVYDLRVRELETQIDDLKERVFRSKSRIALLRETVLAENLAGSRAVITFHNELGRRYKIERAIFSVDGSQVYSEVQPSIDDDGVEIFSGAMTPGTHTMSATLGLQGSGYGVFSYAEGYEFNLRFSCQFTAEEGRTTLVTVRSHKSGNSFTAHEERPDGICEVSMVELAVEDFEDEIEDDIEGELEGDIDVDEDFEAPELD